jgi:hypothetical protein
LIDEEPIQYEQARLIETETWQSGEQDTSQVSVSSLPEDEKSEPSTATVSSTTATHAGDQTTAASAVISTSVGQEEPVLMRVEQRGE